MRLENILSLTGAELMSAPDVTQFEQIVLRPTRVKRGDLFVAYDPRDIPQAVANGAYAVMYDSETEVTDSEIAWIKTDGLDNALLRLLRFHLLEKSLHAVACDRITLALAAQMLKDKRVYVLQETIHEALHRLWELEEGQWVLFPDEQQFDGLFIDAASLPSQGEPVQIIEQTLFETSFVLGEAYYERQMLSPFFLPYLSRLAAFAKQNGLKLTIGGMHGSSHFIPVFVGDDLKVKTFGQGGRVLIFEEDISLMLGEIKFIASEAKWAKIIYLVPHEHRKLLPQNDSLLSYGSKQDIIDILKTVPFHFALIGGQDRRLLETIGMKTEPLTLF